jgi:hypothetical protein
LVGYTYYDNGIARIKVLPTHRAPSIPVAILAHILHRQYTHVGQLMIWSTITQSEDIKTLRKEMFHCKPCRPGKAKRLVSAHHRSALRNLSNESTRRRWKWIRSVCMATNMLRNQSRKPLIQCGPISLGIGKSFRSFNSPQQAVCYTLGSLVAKVLARR